MSIEAMKQALEAFETGAHHGVAIDKLRRAIEQAEKQEPVACVQDLDEVKRKHLVYEKGMDWKDPLYTTPPAAPVQGCDFCNHPLYAGTKCKNCGREAAAQEEIQRLSALVRAQQITIDKLEAQRQWVGLTDEEIDDLYQGAGKNDLKRARSIEAKLKEKNT